MNVIPNNFAATLQGPRHPVLAAVAPHLRRLFDETVPASTEIKALLARLAERETAGR